MAHFDELTNMNSTTFVIYIAFVTLFTIMLYAYYNLIYLRNLQSSECSYINDSLYPKVNTNLRSLNSRDPNCGYLLRDYYIKTAYNACSGGSFSNDYVSTCVLQGIIRQGVRAFDFEVFSMNDMPVISTSLSDDDDSFYYKQTFNHVDFKDMMDTIHLYAFGQNNSAPNPRDPVIIHLRFKSTNQNMYSNLATILEGYNSLLLDKTYSYEYNQQNLGGVPILSFMGKVIIVADMSNPSFQDNSNLCEYINMTSNSLYMRGTRWYDVKYSPDIQGLTVFNKQCMTLAMPDLGISPPNISSIFARTCGCQMLAMQYQKFDSFLEENELFFDTAGYAFVLKDEDLRYVPNVIDKPPPPAKKLSYAPRAISSDYYNFNI